MSCRGRTICRLSYVLPTATPVVSRPCVLKGPRKNWLKAKAQGRHVVHAVHVDIDKLEVLSLFWHPLRDRKS